MMPLALLSNFAGPDMIFIFMAILLLFGAKKLPELARGLGQSLNEFKKAREDVEHEFRQGQQQDPQAREAQNRQPYNPQAAAVPATQALTYNNPAAIANSEQALQQQIVELQEKLKLAEEQSKATRPTMG